MEEESRKYFKWSSFILDLRVQVITTNTHCSDKGGNKEECQKKSNREKSSEPDFRAADVEEPTKCKKNYFDIRIYNRCGKLVPKAREVRPKNG